MSRLRQDPRGSVCPALPPMQTAWIDEWEVGAAKQFCHGRTAACILKFQMGLSRGGGGHGFRKPLDPAVVLKVGVGLPAKCSGPRRVLERSFDGLPLVKSDSSSSENYA